MNITNDCINKLKYLKHVKINTAPKWEKFIMNSNESFNKIRIVYMTRSNPSNFLETHLTIWENDKYICSTQIKLMAFIEQYIFGEEKIQFDSLKNEWIIPINISLFLPSNIQFEKISFSTRFICNCDQDSNNCKCNKYHEKYTVQIQKSINKNEFESVNLHCEGCHHVFDYKATIYFHVPILFIVVWLQDFSTFLYCKFNYFDENDKYHEFVIKKHDLNLVEIYDKKAIIIPTSLNSLSNLSYLFKNLVYTKQDLLDLIIIYKKHTFLELYFSDNNELKKATSNIIYIKNSDF